VIQRTATHADWLALLVGLGITHPSDFHRGILTNIGCGRAWAFRTAQDGPLVALGGIVHSLNESEIWFVGCHRPDRHMLALVHAFRRQVLIDERLIGRPLIARTVMDNLAGRRLVRALGFRFICRSNRMLIWERSEP
jgi:hypothetical protein